MYLPAPSAPVDSATAAAPFHDSERPVPLFREPLVHEPRVATSDVLAAMSDGCLLTVDGQIVEANDALCTLTGFTRQQLIGLSGPIPFWPRAEDATGFDLTTQVITATLGEVDVILCRADGTRFTATVSARLASDRVLISIIRDVSLARAQQAELVAGRALLAQAQAQALLGSWSFDVASGSLTWSGQMFLMHGLREGEIVPTGEDYLSRIHPDDRAGYLNIYLAGIRDGTSHVAEHRIVRPDGSIRHVYGTAVVERDPSTLRAVTLRGSAQDVTDRVARERALLASEEQFRLTMQHSPIGLAIVALDGRWLHVNEALTRIFGTSAEELLSSTFQDETYPEDRGSATGMVLELIAGTAESFQQDRRMVTADGRIAWVSMHIALARDGSGEPEHFIT